MSFNLYSSNPKDMKFRSLGKSTICSSTCSMLASLRSIFSRVQDILKREMTRRERIRRISTRISCPEYWGVGR